MSFLSNLHSEIRKARLTRRGATHHAKDVPRFTHKSYERMERHILPQPAKFDLLLSEALENRRSAHSGDPRGKLTLQECGTLFGLSLSAKGKNSTRNYPSGGALYPIETYLISKELESDTPAVFHYNPTEHSLERMWDLPESISMKDIVRWPANLPLSSLLVFTSVWKRSSAKYGDLAYAHALLEAGHMSQNILLVGTALELEVRPMAGFDDALVTELLDLPDGEQPVHSVTICRRTLRDSVPPEAGDEGV